jgi:hypothetical protein
MDVDGIGGTMHVIHTFPLLEYAFVVVLGVAVGFAIRVWYLKVEGKRLKARVKELAESLQFARDKTAQAEAGLSQYRGTVERSKELEATVRILRGHLIALRDETKRALEGAELTPTEKIVKGLEENPPPVVCEPGVEDRDNWRRVSPVGMMTGSIRLPEAGTLTEAARKARGGEPSAKLQGFA